MKPENQFRSSVHRYIDPLLVHHEKMSNPYRAGGADDWYSGKPDPRYGPSKDLWVEWKFIVIPARAETLIDLVGGKRPLLTPLQQLWLKERHDEGRDVAVGVGSAKGGILLWSKTWETPMTAAEFRGWMRTREELAHEIINFVRGTKP